MVDAAEWHAEICEAIAPVLPQVQEGFSLVAVVDGAGGVEARALDEEVLQDVDTWLEETADLADEVAGDLEDIGAPQTDRGLELAQAQIAMFDSLRFELHNAADQLDPSEPATLADPAAIIQRADETMLEFEESWGDVDPYSRACPSEDDADE